MPFKYDVFLSYTRPDAEWAAKLARDLAKRHSNTFQDQERLKGGDLWEEELLSSLEGSRTLVVLWSESAKASDWVTRERGHFSALMRTAVSQRPSDTRRLIVVELDDTEHAFRSFQALQCVKNAVPRPANAASIDPNVWNTLLERLTEAINADVSSTPINLAILASTQDRLRRLDPRHKPTFGLSLEKALADVGTSQINVLMKYYSKHREQWRPFQGRTDISTMVSNLMIEINQLAGPFGRTFRWQFVGENFWSGDPGEFDREARKLSAGPSLVVVDLLSLYDDDISDRFQRLEPFLERNRQASVMILTPRPVDVGILTLRSLVQSRAAGVFRHLYESADPGRAWQATCGIRVADLPDMKRVMLPTLRQLLGAPSDAEPHAVLRAE